ncbi:Tetratricopeptide repeat protein 39C [Gryllus bimaculatus]|nr:Tetratricopeptide repeat protein 39C [Gryllus bimaculatus]
MLRSIIRYDTETCLCSVYHFGVCGHAQRLESVYAKVLDAVQKVFVDTNMDWLALLWYHTIVRPFFALDGANVRAGVEAAQELIAEAQADFGQSALFLFFRGRVERLRANVEQALAAFEAAAARSPQREVQLLCLHEAGWCRLIQLDWAAARAAFLQLRRRSRWSQAFYAYLAAGASALQL